MSRVRLQKRNTVLPSRPSALTSHSLNTRGGSTYAPFSQLVLGQDATEETDGCTHAAETRRTRGSHGALDYLLRAGQLRNGSYNRDPRTGRLRHSAQAGR